MKKPTLTDLVQDVVPKDLPKMKTEQIPSDTSKKEVAAFFGMNQVIKFDEKEKDKSEFVKKLD